MLTEQQINDIAFYCYQRGVEYYDVQLELVDHLANAIEDMQKANPALGFSEALQTAGNQFSDDEFKKIVKSKKKMLKAKISKLIEKELVAFYTPPKVALTFLIYLIGIYLPYLIKWFGFFPLIIYLAAFVIFAIVYFHPIDKEVKAIKGAMMQPLLSMKVRSKYELIAGIIHACFNILYLISLFIRKDSDDKPVHFTPQKILYLQAFITMATTYAILWVAITIARRNLYTKLWNQYTKAFIS